MVENNEDFSVAYDSKTGKISASSILYPKGGYSVEQYNDSGKPIDNNDNDNNNSFYESDAYKAILGKSKVNLGVFDDLWDQIVGVPESYREKIKNPNIILNCATNKTSKNNVATYTDKNKTATNIVVDHTYSVVDCDDKYIYLINPWDSSEKIQITFEDFKKTFNSFQEVSI